MAVHQMKHNMGDTDQHGALTLSQLNALLTGATLDDQSASRDPNAHASDHENGGGDEISVVGLSGLLADDQNPVAHAASHEGGGDAVSPAGIGAAADPHTLEGAAHTLTFLTNGTLFGRNAAAAIAALPFTSGLTPSTIMSRDSNGRAKVEQAADGAEIPTLDQVNALITTGVHWKDAVAVWKMLNDADEAGAPPAPAPNTDDSAVVDNWGGGTYDNTGGVFADGDVASYNGTGWDINVANVGGFVPSGTKVLIGGTVGGGEAAGSFAGKETQEAEANGAGGWTFSGARAASDEGETRMVYGEDAPQENGAVTFDWNDGASSTFVETQAAIPAHNSTTGIQGGDAGAGEFYHLTQAEAQTIIDKQGEIDNLEADVALAGIVPVRTDVTGAGWGAGSRGIGLGTDGSIWSMYEDGANAWAVGYGQMAAL